MVIRTKEEDSSIRYRRDCEDETSHQEKQKGTEFTIVCDRKQAVISLDRVVQINLQSSYNKESDSEREKTEEVVNCMILSLYWHENVYDQSH